MPASFPGVVSLCGVKLLCGVVGIEAERSLVLSGSGRWVGRTDGSVEGTEELR